MFSKEYTDAISTLQQNITDVKPKLKLRNTDCPAKFFITITTIFDASKSKKTKYTTQEWPCIIKFQGAHNHRTNVAEALREFLWLTKLKNTIELFSRGHSAASAYHTYCMEKIEELDEVYETILCDRLHATKNDVSNLWKKILVNVAVLICC